MAKRRSVARRFLARTFRGEKLGIGAYVWLLHRVTGLLLILYLFAHLYTLSTILEGPEAFNRVMFLFTSPLFKGLELALVWVVLFHTLNGIRLVLLHLLPTANQKRLAYGVTALSLLIVLFSIPLFFR